MVPLLCCIALQKLVPPVPDAADMGLLLLRVKGFLLQGLPATLITSGRGMKEQLPSGVEFLQPLLSPVGNLSGTWTAVIQLFLSYMCTGKMACLAACFSDVFLCSHI